MFIFNNTRCIGANITGNKGQVGYHRPGSLGAMISTGYQRRSSRPSGLSRGDSPRGGADRTSSPTSLQNESNVLRNATLRRQCFSTKRRDRGYHGYRGARPTCLGRRRCCHLPRDKPVATHVLRSRPHGTGNKNQYRRHLIGQHGGSNDQ